MNLKLPVFQEFLVPYLIIIGFVFFILIIWVDSFSPFVLLSYCFNFFSYLNNRFFVWNSFIIKARFEEIFQLFCKQIAYFLVCWSLYWCFIWIFLFDLRSTSSFEQKKWWRVYTFELFWFLLLMHAWSFSLPPAWSS